jgi:hypothetical protein
MVGDGKKDVLMRGALSLQPPALLFSGMPSPVLPGVCHILPLCGPSPPPNNFSHPE